MKPINITKLIKTYTDLQYVKKSYYTHEDTKTAYINRYNEKMKEEGVKLTAAIDEVQYRCTARTIDIYDVCKMVTGLINKLNIPKNKMMGIIAGFDYNAQNFPAAYKYKPYSTVFTVEFKKSGIYVTDIFRTGVSRNNYGTEVKLTKEAEQAILNNYKHF